MKNYICKVHFEKTDSTNYVTVQAEREEDAFLACQTVIAAFPFDLGKDFDIIEIKEV